MNITNFREPRLLWPFVRRSGFIIKRSRDIIDSGVFWLRKIRIAKEILDGGANPSLLRNTKFLQRPDPAVTEIGRHVILVIAFSNLRPAAVLLNKEFSRDVETAQISRTLHSLGAGMQL